MKNNAKSNPRSLALASLLSWEKRGRYANLEVNAALMHAQLSEADRGLYTALTYGVIERAITLDHIIASLSSRPMGEIDEATRSALRLGLYQLLYMDRIPPHAAVSETVAIAPARSRGFVNALLRSFQRSGCHVPLPSTDDLSAHLSVLYSAPPALCRFFLERYEEQTVRSLLGATVANPRVSVRVNTLKFTVDAAILSLSSYGATTSPLVEDVLLLDHAAHIADVLTDGIGFVQDAASRLTVKVLDPKPGETVVDTCAAPGGKSLSIALDMKNTGRLHAFDLHKNKLSLIRKAAEHLGITIIQTEERDAREPSSDLIGQADRVLCDAPCSGLGVIGKKPDIKYKPIESILALPAIQYDILCGAAAYVRPGGVLVYSTCTLNPDENEGVVERFTKAHPDFTLTPFSLASGESPAGMRTFYPHLDGCDGFFVAKMTRKQG